MDMLGDDIFEKNGEIGSLYFTVARWGELTMECYSPVVCSALIDAWSKFGYRTYERASKFPYEMLWVEATLEKRFYGSR